MLPPESEIAAWFHIKEEYFPSSGEHGFIMIKKINVSNEFSTLENLVERLQSPEQTSWNIDKVSPWHNAFRDYVNKFKYTEETFERLISNETYFRSKLTQFLYSPRGMIFQVIQTS